MIIVFGSHFEDDPAYVEHIGSDHRFDNPVRSKEDKGGPSGYLLLPAFSHLDVRYSI